MILQENDRDSADRYAEAREEIRALFDRYRMTARRAAEEPAEPLAAEPDEAPALTGR